MKKPPIPDNEKQRQESLESYQILDSLPEQSLDDLTFIASQICQTPIALVSLVDNDRQWFKSKFGLDADETHRDISFCGHAINDPHQIFEIQDAKQDKRFKDNPLVINDLNIGFYAGVPLVNASNLALGTLCVIDQKPRKLSSDQKKALQALSREVMSKIESRKNQLLLDTEIHQKKQDLNQSEAKYYNLYHEAPDMMVSVDSETRTIKDCNNTLLHKLGYKKTEIINQDIFNVYHPDCHDDVAKSFQNFIQKGTVSNSKLILKKKDGEKLHVTLNVKAIKDENGKIIHSNSIWRDITDLQEAEEKLKELNDNLEEQVNQRTEELEFNRKRLELALNGTNDGILDWMDVSSDQQWWSNHFHELLGYKEGEIAQSFKVFSQELLHPSDLENTQIKIQKCLQEDIPFDLEFRLKTKKGIYKWYRGRGNRYYDNESGVTRMSGSITNIEAQKKLEEKLIKNSKILKNQNEDLKRFANIATHDLKSPMISIEGNFNFLKSQLNEVTNEVNDSISFIDEDISHFNNTLRGLTEALILKETIFVKDSVQLDKIMKQVILSFKSKIDGINASLNVNLDSSDIVIGTEVYLKSIFHNLISNSIKYRSKERTLSIKICTIKKDNSLIITFEDNGIGINLDLQKDYVFKMFKRFHDQQVEGSGMGLYMVKSMVEKIGGIIDIKSKIGLGTIFNIQLELSK